MSKWDDRVRNHPVQAAFDKVLGVLGVLGDLSKERIELAPEDIERLTWVLNHVRARLDSTAAMAVPAQTLDQLNTTASSRSRAARAASSAPLATIAKLRRSVAI